MFRVFRFVDFLGFEGERFVNMRRFGARKDEYGEGGAKSDVHDQLRRGTSGVLKTSRQSRASSAETSTRVLLVWCSSVSPTVGTPRNLDPHSHAESITWGGRRAHAPTCGMHFGRR